MAERSLAQAAKTLAEEGMVEVLSGRDDAYALANFTRDYMGLDTVVIDNGRSIIVLASAIKREGN
jgi:hypothetical protein